MLSNLATQGIMHSMYPNPLITGLKPLGAQVSDEMRTTPNGFGTKKHASRRQSLGTHLM